MMGEGNHTFRLGKAKGMWVWTIFVRVVAPLAIMAVLACWAVSDGVVGVDLSAEVAAVREW